LLPDLPDLPSIYAAGPLAPRVIAGVAGLLLLLAGRRLYRIAIVLPGLVLGLTAGLVLGGALDLPDNVVAVVAVVCGAVGALLAGYVERIALVLAGVLAGLGAIQAGWPLAAAAAASVPTSMPAVPPWWAWPAGAVVGALLFPLLWRVAIVALTAWIGAVVLVDVAGFPADPLVVGGLAVFGMLVQTVSGRPAQKKEED
jgi:hypothetical protein